MSKASAPWNPINTEETSDCSACGASRVEKKLSHCKGCQLAQYCSRECQKKAWHDHKLFCRYQEAFWARKKMRLKIGESDITNMDQFLGEWTKLYTKALIWACWNAFDAKNHPENCDTDVLLIFVDVDPAELAAEEKKPVRMFVVKDGFLVDKRHLPAVSPRLANKVADTNAQPAGTLPQGVAQAAVVCLAVGQFAVLPCEWGDDLTDLPNPVKDWKKSLIEITRTK